MKLENVFEREVLFFEREARSAHLPAQHQVHWEKVIICSSKVASTTLCVSVHSVKSLRFESGTKTITFPLTKFGAKKKLYTNSDSL